MIKYNLICNQDHEFEAWFASSAAFEKQRDNGLIACTQCNSHKVDRAIMAPAIPKKANADKAHKVRHMMQKLGQHVEENFDYVGDDFAEQARQMHYGEAKSRDIYGEATVEEASDLLEEGVPVMPLPGVDKHKKN